jgi:hypothetical protein
VVAVNPVDDGLAVLAVITLLNLRGLGDAARAFLLPTMVSSSVCSPSSPSACSTRWRCTPHH